MTANAGTATVTIGADLTPALAALDICIEEMTAARDRIRQRLLELTNNDA